MLALSRKEGEKLLIGEDVVIHVVKISGGRITLGIDAPKSVKILRGELQGTAPKEKEGVPSHVGVE